MLKLALILSFIFLNACSTFQNTSNRVPNSADEAVDVREVSANEIEVIRSLSSFSAIKISVKTSNEVTDSTDRKHKLFLAGEGTYTLAEMQPAECLEKIKSQRPQSVFNSDGNLVKTGQILEAQSTPAQIEIPLKTYERIIVGFSKSEKFCIFDLKNAALATGLDWKSYAFTNPRMRDSFPIKMIDSSNTSEKEIKYSVVFSYEGSHTSCAGNDCQISVGQDLTGSAVLSFGQK